MICLYCSHPKTQVTNSRGHAKRSFVWRRRYCPECHNTFTTHEAPTFEQLPTVIDKKTGSKSPLDAFRLALSVLPTLDESHSPNEAYELSKTAIEHIMTASPLPKSLSSHDVAAAMYSVLERYNKTSAMQYGLKYKVIRV